MIGVVVAWQAIGVMPIATPIKISNAFIWTLQGVLLDAAMYECLPVAFWGCSMSWYCRIWETLCYSYVIATYWENLMSVPHRLFLWIAIGVGVTAMLLHYALS